MAGSAATGQMLKQGKAMVEHSVRFNQEADSLNCSILGPDARPGSEETADPLTPFVVIAGSFGFAIAAMLVPLVSEFDVAMGRTSGGAD